ncbi:MAG: GNAT family N-acetyltransferase [bacterium]|jgi:ribosomal protein S18 acetylase RimI-like enzyme
MQDYEVRKIAVADASSFRDCLDAVARERKFLAQVEAPPLERMEQFVADSVSKDAAQYVAVKDGNVIGWCDIFPHWAYALQHVGVLGMGVLSPYRGQGLGKRLILQTLAHAREKGIYRVTLEAREDNAKAIRLYESVGFKHEGRAPCAMRFDGVFYAGATMALLQGPAGAA